MAKAQKITFTTSDGAGEATRESPGEAWSVNGPAGSFIWYGTPAEVKREIERRFEEVEFGEEHQK